MCWFLVFVIVVILRLVVMFVVVILMFVLGVFVVCVVDVVFFFDLVDVVFFECWGWFEWDDVWVFGIFGCYCLKFVGLGGVVLFVDVRLVYFEVFECVFGWVVV